MPLDAGGVLEYGHKTWKRRPPLLVQFLAVPSAAALGGAMGSVPQDVKVRGGRVEPSSGGWRRALTRRCAHACRRTRRRSSPSLTTAASACTATCLLYTSPSPRDAHES
eukprot:6316684-Prymnesium_polylepis.2